VVSFEGPKKSSALVAKCNETGVAGILVIEHLIYANGKASNNNEYSGTPALWNFVNDILDAVRDIDIVVANPRKYAP